MADPKHQRPTLTLRPDAHFCHHGLFQRRRHADRCGAIGALPSSRSIEATFDLEYIVVDGGSTDGTLDILAPFRDRIATLISEPDRGLYDAMNKGIRAATGDVVAILNADDVYASTDVLARVAHAFTASSTDAVYGDLNYVAADNLSRVTRRWRSGTYSPGAFRRGWMPPHPALFVRRLLHALGHVQPLPALGRRLRAHASVHPPAWHDADIPARDARVDAGRRGQQRVLQTPRPRPSRGLESVAHERLPSSLFTMLAKPLRKLPQFLSRA